MRVVKDGNFVRWIRELLGLAGIAIIAFSLTMLDETPLRYWFAGFGLVIGSIGGYSAQAHTLGLRPFEKFTWRVAKQTYWPKVIKAQGQQTCADFIANLCLIDQFMAVQEELITRWGQGVAPAMLFGGFGKQLVADWNVLSAPDRSYVCDLIEKAITHGGEQLKSMIRLGLLNSLTEASAKDLSKQPEILAALGEQSRAYVARLMHGASS